MQYTQEHLAQGQKLVETLAHKAWGSSSFKEQLINNPKAAVELVTGHAFPEAINLVAEDQTDESKIYFNIPRKVDINSFELTDEQLEMVAGGDFIVVPAMVGCFAAGVATVGLAVAAYAYFSK